MIGEANGYREACLTVTCQGKSVLAVHLDSEQFGPNVLSATKEELFQKLQTVCGASSVEVVRPAYGALPASQHGASQLDVGQENQQPNIGEPVVGGGPLLT